MTEGEPNGIDKEAWEAEDMEIQLYKNAYYDLWNTYGFLKRSFFHHPDGDSLPIEVTVGKKRFELDAEELLFKTLPLIITKVGERLVDMGETDYVLGVNEIITEEWGNK